MITLICSTNDCIFGGYPALAWSYRNGYVPDPSQKTFIFTVKDPHNRAAPIVKLKDAQCAINDQAQFSPTFDGTAFCVCHKCQTSNSSYLNLNNHCVNDTVIAGNRVMTGRYNFAVNVSEVFELISRE
jgi:hypothetical protein